MDAKPIIEIKDFSYSYPRTEGSVLKDINLTINQGEFVGIVGPTGAGKTTLCLALHGFVPEILGGTVTGSIELLGKNTKTTPISELAFSSAEKTALIGMVFQDPESQLVGMTVEEDVAFGPENLGLPPEEIEARIQEVLRTTRIESYRRVFPYLMSGGEKQRTALASVLAMRPKVLIFDEPTSELDPVGRSEVFDVIRQLKEQADLTIIVVEHHIEDLVKHADRLVVLHEGRIVRQGPTKEIICQTEFLRSVGVRPPEVVEFMDQLTQRGLLTGAETFLDEERAAEYLSKMVQERRLNANAAA